uniref:Uncharacterized protein n=1 Tax=uncultured gamma proteobacterium HF0010_05D02 TaxID=710978 RepID=E0XQM2_9GAMM|nr:hypothetical protein [uncultured gamma proteobacterium HF0010_05D02]
MTLTAHLLPRFRCRRNHMISLCETLGETTVTRLKNKTPSTFVLGVLFFRSLAMTYSHMGKPHTTIGDASFHF